MNKALCTIGAIILAILAMFSFVAGVAGIAVGAIYLLNYIHLPNIAMNIPAIVAQIAAITVLSVGLIIVVGVPVFQTAMAHCIRYWSRKNGGSNE